MTDHEPAATGEVSWLGGTMPLRVTAYAAPTDLPGELVTSVRCVVRVGELAVLCENADGAHPCRAVDGGPASPTRTRR